MTDFFFIEILLGGGPRHNEEFELCEDTAGVFTFPEGAFFYVVDATSDEGKLGPFSSNYFANSLGYFFLKGAFESGFRLCNTLDPGVVLKNAITNLKEQWQNELLSFWKNQDAKDIFLKSSELCTGIRGNGRLKTFSTAFFAGIIDAKTRSAHVVRTGDIDLFVKQEGESPIRKEFKKNRIFGQFFCYEGEEPEFNISELTYESYSAGRLDYFIVKTDGVQFSNEELTLNSLQGVTSESILKFRRILLKGVRRGIGDDKALLYCSFLK